MKYKRIMMNKIKLFKLGKRGGFMNIGYLDTLLKVMPVLLLILLGLFLQRIKFIKQESISDIKKLIINIALPCLLFTAFSQLQLELKHLAVAAIVFGVCIIMVIIGKGTSKLAHIKLPYSGLMFDGFENGMMGYSIFMAQCASKPTGTLPCPETKSSVLRL